MNERRIEIMLRWDTKSLDHKERTGGMIPVNI